MDVPCSTCKLNTWVSLRLFDNTSLIEELDSQFSGEKHCEVHFVLLAATTSESEMIAE